MESLTEARPTPILHWCWFEADHPWFPFICDSAVEAKLVVTCEVWMTDALSWKERKQIHYLAQSRKLLTFTFKHKSLDSKSCLSPQGKTVAMWFILSCITKSSRGCSAVNIYCVTAPILSTSCWWSHSSCDNPGDSVYPTPTWGAWGREPASGRADGNLGLCNAHSALPLPSNASPSLLASHRAISFH